MFLQICHRLTVDLHNLQRTGLLYQILGHHTHAWSHFQDWQVRIGFIHGVRNTAGNVEVSQKMLAEVLLGSHLLHGCKDTIKRAKNQIKYQKRQAGFMFSPPKSMAVYEHRQGF